MEHVSDPDLLTTRLREGFERIATVMRADAWAAAGEAGINPVQAQVLTLLLARPSGLRAKETAAQVGVSAASMADTLSALDRKGFLERTPDPSDARAAIVRLTAGGREQAGKIAAAASHVRSALAQLSSAEQADLLLTQMKLIRTLQVAGAIPVQRMCVSCRHFRPNAHLGDGPPHHCAFVNSPIGDRDLRLDCGEHEAADPSVQSSNWAAMVDRVPPPSGAG